MGAEARKQSEAFGRSEIETVMADLITLDNVLWRPGEVLCYLTHHRIFACLPELVQGYRFAEPSSRLGRTDREE